MVAAAVMNLRFLFINGEVTLPLGLLQGNSDMVQQREGYEYRSRGGILHVFGGQVTRHESGFLPPGNVLMVCVLPLGLCREPVMFRGCVKMPGFRYKAGIRGNFASAGVSVGAHPTEVGAEGTRGTWWRTTRAVAWL